MVEWALELGSDIFYEAESQSYAKELTEYVYIVEFDIIQAIYRNVFASKERPQKDPIFSILDKKIPQIMMAYQYTLDLINREVKFNAIAKLKPVSSSFKAFKPSPLTFDVLPPAGSVIGETTQVVSINDTNWSREMIEGILLKIIINKAYLILGVISKRHDPKMVCKYLGIRNFTILTAHTIQSLAQHCHTGYQILWEPVYKSFLEIAVIKNRSNAYSVINDKLTKLMNHGVQKQNVPKYRLDFEDDVLPEDPILFYLPDDDNPGSSILRSDYFTQMKKVENNQPTKLKSVELSQIIDPTKKMESKLMFGSVGYKTISKIFGLDKDKSQHQEGPNRIEEVVLPGLDLGKLFGMGGESVTGEIAQQNKESRRDSRASRASSVARTTVARPENLLTDRQSSSVPRGQSQGPVKSKIVHQALKKSLEIVLSRLSECVIEDEDIEQQIFLGKEAKKSKKALSKTQI